MDSQSYIKSVCAQNALKYGGVAQPGAVLGKVVSTYPQLKADMKALSAQIKDAIAYVSTLSAVEQEALAALLVDPNAPVQKKGKKELKELDGAKAGNVVMRFAPSASGGYMHIGHAITGGLTSAYVKKYGGKFILRIEDTDSSKADPLAYTTMQEDADWIFGNVHEVVIQSDRMELYYQYVRRFVEQSNAYVCTCSGDEWKKHIDAGSDCPCRNLSSQVHLDRFNAMFDKTRTKEGDCVLRFKSTNGMSDVNPAMRDFPLMRINDDVHPRQGTTYRVWPLMNLSVFVDDAEMGMTHIIRAKDHMDNAKRQAMMYAAVNKTPPHTYFTGRYNIEGLEISKTRTKELIAQGAYSGWEDIRLAFLRPLKRRGYQPEAFIAYTTEVGLSQVDKTITAEDFFAKLDACNKDCIDDKTNRYAMLVNPTPITIEQYPSNFAKSIELKLHPTLRQQGRPVNVSSQVLLEALDIASFSEGMLIRLMDFCNVQKVGDRFIYVSESYEEFKESFLPKTIVHWLSGVEHEVCIGKLLKPDGQWLSLLLEKNVQSQKVGDVVQFERYGFARMDAFVNGVYEFWFAHK